MCRPYVALQFVENNDDNDGNDYDEDNHKDNNNNDNDNNNNDDDDNDNDSDNNNNNHKYFSLQLQLTTLSKLVSWRLKLLLKAGDIAENPGPVNGSQDIRNILSFRLVLALLFVYTVKVGENEGKCCVLNS